MKPCSFQWYRVPEKEPVGKSWNKGGSVYYKENETLAQVA